MSRSVQPTNYSHPEPPTYRIEYCGNIQVHHPVKVKP